ncbi:MAG: NAD-dependent epimerase/dehydratase family protein [Enhydrobacter sp.]|nr:MAG: NAD-dependent epimerase/dehydratase family protein [Enhydrobacter sp.]
MSSSKPLVLITGASGNVGRSIAAALKADYRVVGLDREGADLGFPVVATDLTSDERVAAALNGIRERHGDRIASVIHLAAYFDFTGEDNPLYREVNVEGTRRLLRALQSFPVEQFVYSGTMLVHEACRPGERIDESRPVAPTWAYPQSKADAEEAIRAEHGRIPYVLLHLAGLYDDRTTVPTLAEQIARIYEGSLQGHLYAGSTAAGQSMLHREDMIDAFRRVVDRRAELPRDATLLVGEPDAMSYAEIQDLVGSMLHGDPDWTTIEVPKPVAKAGAWAQHAIEPLVPDALDQGEKPFIRPFMIDMADDHYALDVSRARDLLGWRPRHRLADELPKLVESLRSDPLGWYEANKVTPPPWIAAADKAGHDPEELRQRDADARARAHGRYRWAGFANIFLGAWLATSPPLIGVAPPLLAWSDVACGCIVMVLGALALTRRNVAVRWAAAGVGTWVMCAPFVFWTPEAAAYLNGTLVGGLIFAFAVCTPPEPGPSPLASASGPSIPSGWSYNPSAWTQRIPIIALAVIGLIVSRYLAAYQLGHTDAVWEPFFAGGPDPRNGTEEIITSSVSQAWPVPDAAVGGLVYALEILAGVGGSTRRWRTMPWLVLLFGLLIVPLGVVSITFIVIQPIVIGTWCTLCLIAAAAMLVQIPYSLDELVASVAFLRRRRAAGRPVLRVLLFGDTDAEDRRNAGEAEAAKDEFDRPALVVAREMVGGGVSLPWSLAVSAAIGVWLMLTRLTLDAEGAMADGDHLIGALVLTTTAIACAEVARVARFLNVVWGVALIVLSFVLDATAVQQGAAIACGVALVALSMPRGDIRHVYGEWTRQIV